jgi:predicted proteasome-type protease
MARALDRDKLLAAFDEIGRAAVSAGTRLEIAVYGGSALMLASNFRYNTEDVDIAAIERPWPEWLRQTVERLAHEMGWIEDWFNDGVAFHLSALADRSSESHASGGSSDDR